MSRQSAMNHEPTMSFSKANINLGSWESCE
ncbi:hypothetical protein BH11PSE8_BH11PSE8_04710 [soil metagenome]